MNFVTFLRAPFFTEHLWWLYLFLLCGENKTRLTELIFQTMEDEKDEILDLLKSEEIVISREEVAERLTVLK